MSAHSKGACTTEDQNIWIEVYDQDSCLKRNVCNIFSRTWGIELWGTEVTEDVKNVLLHISCPSCDGEPPSFTLGSYRRCRAARLGSMRITESRTSRPLLEAIYL